MGRYDAYFAGEVIEESGYADGALREDSGRGSAILSVYFESKFILLWPGYS